MKLAVLKETAAHEARVAITPDLVKKYVTGGYQVHIESQAGLAAGISDDAFQQAGATITPDAVTAATDAALLLCVQAPSAATLGVLQQGATVIGLLDPTRNTAFRDACAAKGVTSFALENVPRTTRAQSMDVLSSQANLAGYRAVLEAALAYPHALPMFMTAAGTIAPARVFVMGAGVAGLQAIATARRLGAIVSATDVRMAAKEQVESLGASFIMVEDDEIKNAETSGGYAREMSDAYKQKQAALIANHITKQDIVICTALIPGRTAPTLVSEEMLKTMKRGSVLVDLATAWGGNCPVSVADEITAKHGVTVIGYSNMAARIAGDASALYAKNIFNFLALIIDPKGPVFTFDWNDPILSATALTVEGKVFNPSDKAEKAA